MPAGGIRRIGTPSPATLREQVTSKGGTTEAALKMFDGDDKALRALVEKAVAAAAKRAGELTD